MSNKILLLGYAGYRNYGDDLLLKQAYDKLYEHVNLTIHTSNVSKYSDYLHEWFSKAEIVKSKNLSPKFIKTFDKVLYFGGGVFFDYREYTLFQYWRKRLSIIKNFLLPNRLGVPFGGIGIGIGPFSTQRGHKITTSLLGCFDILYVRDEKSLKFAKKVKSIKELNLINDLSLAHYEEYRNQSKNIDTIDDLITICARHYPHGKKQNSYIQSLLNLCIKLQKAGKKIRVIGFQANHDENIISQFENLGMDTIFWNPDKMNLEDIVKLFAESEGVITARMHGTFIAGITQTPTISIGVHPKLIYASSLFEKSICVEDVHNISIDIDFFKNMKSKKNLKHDLEMISGECITAYDRIREWCIE